MGAHCAPLRKEKSSAVPLISQRSHVGNLRQTNKQKEVGVKRVETLVSTLLPRRGARRIPALRRAQLLARFQAKNSPPVRGEHANAVRVPRSVCAKKEPPRIGRTRLRQFASPAQPVLKKAAARKG